MDALPKTERNRRELHDAFADWCAGRSGWHEISAPDDAPYAFQLRIRPEGGVQCEAVVPGRAAVESIRPILARDDHDDLGEDAWQRRVREELGRLASEADFLAPGR